MTTASTEAEKEAGGERREDGSYAAPTGPGRWWVKRKTSGREDGYVIESGQGGRLFAEGFGPLAAHLIPGDRWWPVTVPGLDCPAPCSTCGGDGIDVEEFDARCRTCESLPDPSSPSPSTEVREEWIKEAASLAAERLFTGFGGDLVDRLTLSVNGKPTNMHWPRREAVAAIASALRSCPLLSGEGIDAAIVRHTRNQLEEVRRECERLAVENRALASERDAALSKLAEAEGDAPESIHAVLNRYGFGLPEKPWRVRLLDTKRGFDAVTDELAETSKALAAARDSQAAAERERDEWKAVIERQERERPNAHGELADYDTALIHAKAADPGTGSLTWKVGRIVERLEAAERERDKAKESAETWFAAMTTEAEKAEAAEAKNRELMALSRRTHRLLDDANVPGVLLPGRVAWLLSSCFPPASPKGLPPLTEVDRVELRRRAQDAVEGYTTRLFSGHGKALLALLDWVEALPPSPLSTPGDEPEDAPGSGLEADPAVGRPPVACAPRWIRAEQRIHEIQEATARYLRAGKEIPSGWSKECGELVEWLRQYHPSSLASLTDRTAG